MEEIFESGAERLGLVKEGGLLDLFTNVTLVTMMLASLIKTRPFPKTSHTFKDSYDYIIVGGGTAGSVMANRLSQRACVSVLLLEAGGEASVLTDIPAFTGLLKGTDIDWAYRTEPQKYGAFSQKENRVIWNSGKVLGGSSTLNAMLYVRGNRKNYDDWEAEGATGWGYKDVFPYFLKLEDNKEADQLDPGYHGRGGPMTVERLKYSPEIKLPILEATADLGLEECDVNGKRQTGVFDLQATVRNQQRCSTAKAYLVPAEDRPNLDIVKRAFVTKIILRKGRAVGVEFDHGGKRHKVWSEREVIVSSGTVRTPQLLMLSGIGPREELHKFNISVVVDLPVGKNLMDHYATPLFYHLKTGGVDPFFDKFHLGTFLDYVTKREGPFGAPNQLTLLAFLDGLNTSSSVSRDFPKQELYFAEYATLDAKLNYNLKEGVYERVFAPYEHTPLYACIVSLLQPRSTGTITLRSADPYDHPKIDPNYYQHPTDLRDMVEGMKVCQRVSAHPSLQRYGASLLDTQYPPCRRFRGDEDRILACIALQVIYTFWHPTGTARMGHPKDPRSVVDPQLRVIGVKGLRVVNAAVMPIIPSANTNVPTMMIAEKAYDMMKDDIRCSGRKSFSSRRRHRSRLRA